MSARIFVRTSPLSCQGGLTILSIAENFQTASRGLFVPYHNLLIFDYAFNVASMGGPNNYRSRISRRITWKFPKCGHLSKKKYELDGVNKIIIDFETDRVFLSHGC